MNMRPTLTFISRLLLGFILLFILSACGGATESESESAVSEAMATENTAVAVVTTVPATATEVSATATEVPASPTIEEPASPTPTILSNEPTATTVANRTAQAQATETSVVESKPTETPTPLPPTASPTMVPTEPPTASPTMVPTEPPPASPTADPDIMFEVANVASDDVLNVRAKPGVGNPIVGTIPYDGTEVEITGPSQQINGNPWVPIKYKEITGWVNSYYLANKSDASDQAVGDRAREIILALKNKDLAAFAKFVHPDKGVRFSAYTFVHVTSDPAYSADLVFSAAEMSNLFADPTVYRWGVFDGIGTPIDMTFAEYFERFVYDVDFANPDAIGYNQMIGQGNTINNIAQIYPEATVVEYYLEGSEEYGGLDWRSLRLVLEQKNGVWYLVAVVHDEWTI